MRIIPHKPIVVAGPLFAVAALCLPRGVELVGDSIAARMFAVPFNAWICGILALLSCAGISFGVLGMLSKLSWGPKLAAAGAFGLAGAIVFGWLVSAVSPFPLILAFMLPVLGSACAKFSRDRQPPGKTKSFSPSSGSKTVVDWSWTTPNADKPDPLPPLYKHRPSQPSSSFPKAPPPSDRTLKSLDSGLFAPLSDAEIKRRAKSRGTGGSWFQMLGMRGRIPPVTDERTLLIDRALVAHGLLSPEELTKIHEVGAEYEKLRPSFQAKQQAEYAAGQQALADDDAAKAATREEKKAAAAERREKRAAAIAERRRTDIVFLGRGVSAGLADRRANVERLAAFGLPVLAAPADIAGALGIPVPRLRWLAFHSEASEVSHYIRFTIAKKSGGFRELAAPHRDMAAAQQWILANILELLPVRDCAHGFVKGRSVMTNAVPHVRRDRVVNADLKDFFPTVTFPRVKGIFESLGYSPAAATVLALICTDSPRRLVDYDGQRLHVATGPRCLPQGACTSPALSNMAARKLDARLEGVTRKTGWTYTRYADDLTFSASGETASRCGGLLLTMRRLCAEEGFTVNEKKTRVQRQNSQQSVTGVVVNRRPNVPRTLRRRLRAILHNARTTGLAAQNTENHPNFPLWVRGMIAWISSTNPDEGRKLLEAFKALSTHETK